MKKTLIPLLIFIGVSCNNEVNIQAPYRDIPVVYSILNQNDSVHFLRLEKSFAGEMNAYDMAAVADSIYYPEARVIMERWRDGEYRETLYFSETDTIIRDSGIFANFPNRIFANTDKLDGASEYRLFINIPGKEDTIVARTRLVDQIRLIKPPYTQPSLNLSQYTGEIKVEWVSAPNARVYFLQVRFNYLEVFLNDTVPKALVWNIANYVSEHAGGGERMSSDISHELFYRWLPTKLSIPEAGVKRIAHKQAFDFLFTVGGEELYTYMQIYNPNEGIHQEKPVYTNISGGIGLFSARFHQELRGKSLTFPSIDSLSYGIYTKSLGFVNSRDDYYNR